MPRGKRVKKQVLTQVSKRPARELKDALIDNVRGQFEKYTHCYVIDLGDSRPALLKQVREHFHGTGTVVFGKRKVMGVALGPTKDTSFEKGTYRLIPFITSSSGLFFSSLPQDKVLSFFESFSRPDFAVPGQVSINDFVVPAGPLPVEAFSGVEMVNHLSTLGLPCRLDEGIIVVLDTVTAVKAGEVLNAQQCRLLRLFGEMQGTFRVRVNSFWTGGKVFGASPVVTEALAASKE